MRRRDLVAVFGAVLVLPAAGYAQRQTGSNPRIAYLGSGGAVPSLQEAFERGLRELGWSVGENILIEYRFAEGQDDRLTDLAVELVRSKVVVIVASPTPAALAAQKATKTIPVVGIGFDNPSEHGLVASLAHPGGNVTGLSYGVGPEIFGKDLELLKEVVPQARRIAVLSNSTSPNHRLMMETVTKTAPPLGVELTILDARGPDEFETAFATMGKQSAEALFVFGDPMLSMHRARLAAFAAQSKLPTMYTHRLHVEAGGLMCYGPSFSDLWRRAAGYVDKILRGAKPADLPVEQPTKFELVINLKTAKALGLTVPNSILARADEILE